MGEGMKDVRRSVLMYPRQVVRIEELFTVIERKMSPGNGDRRSLRREGYPGHRCVPHVFNSVDWTPQAVLTSVENPPT